MSMSVEVDGRMIDVTYPRNVSAKDRKLLRKQLAVGWNAYIDKLCEEKEMDIPGVSPLAAQVFESARLVRHLFVPLEKMRPDKSECYSIGKFKVTLVGSSCPTQRSLVVSLSHCGREFARVAQYENPFSGAHRDTGRFSEKSPLNTEFIEAVKEFCKAARSDVERIMIFHGMNHVAFAAYPEYLRRRLK